MSTVRPTVQTNPTQNGGIWKCRLYILVWRENILKTELVKNKRWRHDNHTTCCVFKFLRRSVEGKHLMRFQSENVVFKFLRVVWKAPFSIQISGHQCKYILSHARTSVSSVKLIFFWLLVILLCNVLLKTTQQFKDTADFNYFSDESPVHTSFSSTFWLTFHTYPSCTKNSFRTLVKSEEF